MGKMQYIIINEWGKIQILGKIMTKWEHINNKHFHSHLSYSHSRPIPISLSNLVSIPSHGNSSGGMGIPHFPFPCISLIKIQRGVEKIYLAKLLF